MRAEAKANSDDLATGGADSFHIAGERPEGQTHSSHFHKPLKALPFKSY